jgi:hypothetical protein
MKRVWWLGMAAVVGWMLIGATPNLDAAKGGKGKTNAKSKKGTDDKKGGKGKKSAGKEEPGKNAANSKGALQSSGDKKGQSPAAGKSEISVAAGKTAASGSGKAKDVKGVKHEEGLTEGHFERRSKERMVELEKEKERIAKLEEEEHRKHRKGKPGIVPKKVEKGDKFGKVGKDVVRGNSEAKLVK